MDISSSQADSFVKLFGSWSSDYGVDVKPFNNEYIVLATITNTETDKTDIGLIITDIYGNQKGDIDTIDGGGDDIASKLLLTSDGGFIILGTTEDTLNKNQDIFLAKYNSQIEKEWQKNIGTTNNEQGVSIKNAQTGYIIVGNTDKQDAVNGNPKGEWDIYLVKIDESGNIEWENNFGAEGEDMSSDVITTGQGYLIVGTSNSFDESGQGGKDIIAIKTNSTGSETDKFTYGGIYNDNGNSVIEVSDGYVIVGSVENISNDNSDVYVVKVDKDDLQNIIWNKSFSKTFRCF